MRGHDQTIVIALVLLAFGAGLYSGSLQAADEPPRTRQYPATIHTWVDGDTVDLIVDLGFRINFRDRFRLVTATGGWFDAPEMRGPEREEGQAALAKVQAAFPPGAKVQVTTFKDDSRGKYGRWLVWIPGAIEAQEVE